MKYNELSAIELDELIIFINDNYAKKIASKSSNHNNIQHTKNVIYCPKCGSFHVNKNGKTKTGIQKLICSDCKKSFSYSTQSITYHSKYPYQKWKDFIECELLNMTLRETAAKLNIAVSTAFFWRHKVHLALNEYMSKIKLTNIVQLDATYEQANFKGLKPNLMPRKSKKRFTASNLKHKVCIMTGCDDSDNVVISVTNSGREGIISYEGFKYTIDNPKLIISDQAWGFTTLAKDLNCQLEQIPTSAYVSNNGYDINTLNQIHSELKLYLSKYHGVSLRHLQGYLDMFCIKKMFNYKFTYDNKIINIYSEATKNYSTYTTKEITKIPFPFDIYTLFKD